MKDLKEICNINNISTSLHTLLEASILDEIEDTIENGEDAVKKIYYIPQVKDFKKCRMYGQKYETYYVDWNIDWWISQYNIDMSEFEYGFRFIHRKETEYVLRFVLTLEEKRILGNKWSLSLHLVEKDQEFRGPEHEDRLYGWHGWEGNKTDINSPYLVIKGNINKYLQKIIDLINDLADVKNKDKFKSIFEHTGKLANQGFYARTYKGTFSEPDYQMKNLFEL